MLRITELREKKGISMKETARLLNLPYTTYVNYEKGLREPTSEILIQIADFFHVSIDYLLGRNETPALSDKLQRGNATTLPEGFDAIVSEININDRSFFSRAIRRNKTNAIEARGRDGSVINRTLTDEQFAAIKAILKQLPNAIDDL